ncbi:MAG: ORF6N domain-containing protein [Saprospiraceae bacterium]|nr:ORF6N domain-containing protein [Saprospiraceae bacterium]MCF8251737.1 ORF6N domain-containing protein [Saprospiraceae bacterium]MCF8281119.1 ORF6N domain-containing protein [Bacteroidales bacterium]MCF8311791.1 ORF6N domain-containing protein [Saprospiraceae bacterium]MCF8441759.1 ORF6N domain-containing protein [Saprospiraceae bacterium]
MELKTIHQKILVFRGQKVMLDFDLAALYEVETRALKQAVKRNLIRFPKDFMFELSQDEIDEVVSQNVIPSKSHLGGAIPFAFTEQGVAMLSSILKSEKAALVNIAIMRTFVMIRRYAMTYEELAQKIQELESKYDDVQEVLNQLLLGKEREIDWEKRERIGFKK